MLLAPTLTWTLGEPPHAVDARLLPLLRGVLSAGSLAAAVRRAGLSYRAAWGLLRDYEHLLGVPLVELSRGRGASLAPAGLRLLELDHLGSERIASLLSGLTSELGRPSRSSARKQPARMTLAASHDLALAALHEPLQQVGLELELSFMGSLHALQTYRAGNVQAAGFHVAMPAGTGAYAFDTTPFRHLLRAGSDRLIAFVEREQGLMLGRAAPARIRSFREIAARQLRFVNRQRGSGTRLVIDELLKREGVAPSGVPGFDTEEFTHRAIAATIASGAADVGFGLRAAAEERDLAFIPLVSEAYYLATKAAALRHASVTILIEFLRSPQFGTIVRSLPGYRALRAGTVVFVDAL